MYNPGNTVLTGIWPELYKNCVKSLLQHNTSKQNQGFAVFVCPRGDVKFLVF